jgi:hypothetical protein
MYPQPSKIEVARTRSTLIAPIAGASALEYGIVNSGVVPNSSW